MLTAENKDISAYIIYGNNYIKLADLDKALGFKVDWDKNSSNRDKISKIIFNKDIKKIKR